MREARKGGFEYISVYERLLYDCGANGNGCRVRGSRGHVLALEEGVPSVED